MRTAPGDNLGASENLPPAAPQTPSAGPLRCTVLTDPDALAPLRPPWQKLLHRSSANEPMLSPGWLLTWWDTFGRDAGCRLRFGCFYEGDQLVGLAPLQSRRVWYRGGIPFRRLEPLGVNLNAADGVYSEYLNLIIERGKEPQVLAQFVLALMSGQFGRFHEIVIPAMSGSNPLLPLLAEACSAAGLHTEVTPTSISPYIALPASWEEYVRLLGKHRRYLVKTLRDFEAWADGKAEFHRATKPDQLIQGQRILIDLHAERWRQAGRNGVFQTGRFAAFHDRVMREFLAAGNLDLQWLTVAGDPVAALYSLRWNRKIYFYQAGRKMDMPGDIRPGIVLHAHAIRDAITTGMREYDFLEGAAQYKRQLAPAERPIVQFRAVRLGVRENIRRFSKKSFVTARSWWRWLCSRGSERHSGARPTHHH